jgi:hypothetical protein
MSPRFQLTLLTNPQWKLSMTTRFQLTLLTNPYTAYSTSHPFRCKTKDIVKQCVLQILDEVNVTRVRKWV